MKKGVLHYEKAEIAGFGVAVATIMASFMFAPGESTPIAGGAFRLGIHQACARRSVCKRSPGDICFASNGSYYPDYEYVGEIE